MAQAQSLTVESASARHAGSIGLLAAEISAACDEQPDTMRQRIRAALARAAAIPQLLRPDQRVPQADCYARHILYSDLAGRFTILAIVWGAGQFSPPHAHHTWCAYAVCESTLEETVFAWNAATGRAEQVRTETRPAGYSWFSGAGLDQIHRLGNSGPDCAISIHVYGVERERVATHVNQKVDVASEKGTGLESDDESTGAAAPWGSAGR
jgi:predicted metal-dependent enzyme (double-stranded beta helix superfamily)